LNTQFKGLELLDLLVLMSNKTLTSCSYEHFLTTTLNIEFADAVEFGQVLFQIFGVKLSESKKPAEALVGSIFGNFNQIYDLLR